MKLTVLGSGSSGNAVLIVAGNTRVLVDAGLSAKEIARRLALVGEDAQRLDGVLVTHEHGDHAGGLRVLLGSVDCPVYISAQTLDAYVSERFNVTNDEPRRRADALRDRVEQIESSKDFRIGENRLSPVHDPARRRRQFRFHGDASWREDRNRDGLRSHHYARIRTPARLRCNRHRVEIIAATC
jgi:phosphoribosyl 1,2-cyclic phosphodiesterase